MASHLLVQVAAGVEPASSNFCHLDACPRRWHRRPMHFVYILRCTDNSLYTGETPNLAGRLAKHNEGSASHFTAQRRPVSLVYAEEYPDRSAALRRERQIKRWSRAKKEALVAGDRRALKRA